MFLWCAANEFFIIEWLLAADIHMAICRQKGLELMLPVGVLHAAAFLMGYWLCVALKFNEKTARTVSIETGLIWRFLSPLSPPSSFALSPACMPITSTCCHFDNLMMWAKRTNILLSQLDTLIKEDRLRRHVRKLSVIQCCLEPPPCDTCFGQASTPWGLDKKAVIELGVLP